MYRLYPIFNVLDCTVYLVIILKTFNVCKNIHMYVFMSKLKNIHMDILTLNIHMYVFKSYDIITYIWIFLHSLNVFKLVWGREEYELF